ncbi:hypothetical protein HDU93_003433 [Gonapodya sp. JEL0774]|nr:hypothetical protein HDU93_003433 [Gonapodya sp. JEL0774]
MPDDGDSTPRFPGDLVVLGFHGAIPAFTYLFLTPIAILVMRYRLAGSWTRRWHQYVHLGARPISFLSQAFDQMFLSHFSNGHAILGTVLILILPLQLVVGYSLKAEFWDKQSAREAIVWIHRILGFSYQILALSVLSSGVASVKSRLDVDLGKLLDAFDYTRNLVITLFCLSFLLFDGLGVVAVPELRDAMESPPPETLNRPTQIDDGNGSSKRVEEAMGDNGDPGEIVTERTPLIARAAELYGNGTGTGILSEVRHNDAQDVSAGQTGASPLLAGAGASRTSISIPRAIADTPLIERALPFTEEGVGDG